MWRTPSDFEGTNEDWGQGLRSVYLAALGCNGLLLKYAPPIFRAEYEIVSAAVSQNGQALYYAYPSLKNDRHIVELAITGGSHDGRPRFLCHPCASPLSFASETLRADRELALLACTHPCADGCDALRHVSRDVVDESLVFECLTANGENLRFMDKDVRCSKTWVEIAMRDRLGVAHGLERGKRARKDVRSLVFADPSLWSDEALLLQAATADDDFLSFWLGGTWSADPEASEDVRSVLRELPKALVCELGRTSRSNMRVMCGLFPADLELAKDVARAWPELHRRLHESVFEDLGVVEAFAATDGYVVLSSKRYSKDRSVMLAAVATTPGVFERLGAELQDDKEIALAAVSQQGHLFKHVSARLLRDRDVCMKAALNYSTALVYAHESLRRDVGFVRELMFATVQNKDSHPCNSSFFSTQDAFAVLNDVVARACFHVLDYRRALLHGGCECDKVVAAIVDDVPRLAAFAKTSEEFDTAVATVAKHVTHEDALEATLTAHAAYYRPQNAAGEDSSTLSEWKRSAPLEFVQDESGPPSPKRQRLISAQAESPAAHVERPPAEPA